MSVRVYAHDPNLGPACGCWSCDNARQVAEHRARKDKERAEARAATAPMVVSYLGDDVFELEIPISRAYGTMAQILNDPGPYERPVVELFQKLTLADRLVVMLAARRRKRVVVGQIEFPPEED